MLKTSSILKKKAIYGNVAAPSYLAAIFFNSRNLKDSPLINIFVKKNDIQQDILRIGNWLQWQQGE